MNTFPNYYAILDVPESATTEEIREAYKRKALDTHPDRFASNLQGSTKCTELSQEEAKIRFQRVADAYYVLSDEGRRKQYDKERASRRKQEASTLWQSSQADPNQIFGNVFEDLLRPEVENHGWFYTPIGAVSGACLGFIFGNFPGLVVGAYAGKKLGAIRDAKGISVYDAYSRLNGSHKAAILAALATKLVSSGNF
ncbi:4875_t:CDS:2 [Funneliformis mosseae]|uniref:4875_t:CDS:1 n=1 Tax=Funneliformis mosseae TaxID=27381 RepID=A0A9N9G3Q2_FUNMO|nr:4875_t:CDS:2 [Funneliformis mosseae]